MKLIFVGLFCFFISCTNFLSKFEDIQLDKTRNIAIVLEPAEAAPGDTVHVKYIGFSPDSASLTMHWTIALDFAEGTYSGTAVESHIVNMDAMMLPGHTPTDFYFVVPDSTLLYSTYLKGLFRSPWALNLSIPLADSILKAAVNSGTVPPPAIAHIADIFGTKIKLNVHVSAEYSLDVYKYMTIRYTRKLGSSNTNVNPTVRWIAVYDVPKGKVTSFDSVARYEPKVNYLYYDPKYADTSIKLSDTIDIDTGHTYYLVADSGINGTDTAMQSYQYLSIDGSIKTARENYYYQWFYQDLDFRSPMVYDSLLMFGGSNALGNATRFLTPVDTAMHHFKFYFVLRDSRQDFEAVGVSEYEVSGYFRYKENYAKNPHNQ